MKAPSRTRIFTILILTSMLTWIIATPVVTLIAYPTEQHREVARKLDRLTTKAWQGGDSNEIYQSDTFKQLDNSQENNYSITVGLIGYVIAGLLSIGLPGWVYYRLRRSRATKHTVPFTILIASISQFIATNVLYTIVLRYYVGIENLSLQAQLIGSAGSLFIILLLTVLFTLAWQGHYDKYNNFVVE